MARYTGPKWRISRRENADVFGDPSWRKRPTPPGQHGLSSKGRPSNYAIQFREKQKLKRTYGLLERQFSNLYKKAIKATGNTGTRLLQLLETRLDNVVFRLAMAKTREQARQFVTHGHIMVNGQKLDVASYNVNVGDVIEYETKFAKNDITKVIRTENKNVQIPAWLQSGKVISIPTRDMIDPSIREQMVIEFYSR